MKTLLLQLLIFAMGIAGLSGVAWLGYLTATNPSAGLVAIFGVASAILAPIGFALLGYAVNFKERGLISNLSKVPAIEKLVSEAKSQEEKIRLLEEQKRQLVDLIRVEARRQYLLAQKETTENNASRMLHELKAIDDELLLLDKSVTSNHAIMKELTAVRDRVAARQRGGLVISLGRRSFIVEESFFHLLPWGGLVYSMLKLTERISEHLLQWRRSLHHPSELQPVTQRPATEAFKQRIAGQASSINGADPQGQAEAEREAIAAEEAAKLEVAPRSQSETSREPRGEATKGQEQVVKVSE